MMLNPKKTDINMKLSTTYRRVRDWYRESAALLYHI